MTAGFALWRGSACDDVALAEGRRSAQAQQEALPDKRPGTVARHAVVVRQVSPCQTGGRRAGSSGKPLIASGFYRADASGREVMP
jgi:hypothetical protein